MARLQAAAEQRVERPSREVYAAIADYGGQHRRALPEAYHDYTVESGGSGAGTVVSWVLHVGTHQRPYRMQVTEPQPGETLREQDGASSFATEWRVEPEGDASRVRLVSTWEQRSRGVPALFERLFAPRSLARLHQETLRRLAANLRG